LRINDPTIRKLNGGKQKFRLIISILTFSRDIMEQGKPIIPTMVAKRGKLILSIAKAWSRAFMKLPAA
jgi:hypothetical protein